MDSSHTGEIPSVDLVRINKENQPPTSDRKRIGDEDRPPTPNRSSKRARTRHVLEQQEDLTQRDYTTRGSSNLPFQQISAYSNSNLTMDLFIKFQHYISTKHFVFALCDTTITAFEFVILNHLHHPPAPPSEHNKPDHMRRHVPNARQARKTR